MKRFEIPGWLFIAAYAIVLLCLLLVGGKVRADWSPKFAQSSPDMQDWFRQQRNAEGAYCCDSSEAISIEDWDHDATGYKIKVAGVWYAVNAKAMTFTVSITGGALAWIYPRGSAVSTETIRCFIPGPEG